MLKLFSHNVYIFAKYKLEDLKCLCQIHIKYSDVWKLCSLNNLYSNLMQDVHGDENRVFCTLGNSFKTYCKGHSLQTHPQFETFSKVHVKTSRKVKSHSMIALKILFLLMKFWSLAFRDEVHHSSMSTQRLNSCLFITGLGRYLFWSSKKTWMLICTRYSNSYALQQWNE